MTNDEDDSYMPPLTGLLAKIYGEFRSSKPRFLQDFLWDHKSKSAKYQRSQEIVLVCEEILKEAANGNKNQQ